MGLRKITDAEYLVHEIDEMIRDLQLRKSKIISTIPTQKQPELMTHFHSPSGRVFEIKGRKKR